MNNWTIQENFKLPSLGKVYTPNIEPEFSLRSMTTSEEMLRLSPSDHQYENMCQMIDNCMVKSPGISAYDMCLGDYIYCLYMLRIVTYGEIYNISPRCAFCGKVGKEQFNLHDLTIKYYSEEMDKYMHFELPVSKAKIELQLQTPRLLDNTLDRINMYKKRIESNLDSTIMCEIMNSIKTVDGILLNEIKLEDFVRELNMQDINTILNYSKKANDFVGIDNKLIITCDFCGLTYASNLAITQEFFRPTLDI